MQGLTDAGERVTRRMQSVLLGVDRDGRFLIDNRRLGRVQSVRPKAVILAVGSVEQVSQREGWELPGVVTVGGLQVQFKETGRTPTGPILLAGSIFLPISRGFSRATQAAPFPNAGACRLQAALPEPSDAEPGWAVSASRLS